MCLFLAEGLSSLLQITDLEVSSIWHTLHPFTTEHPTNVSHCPLSEQFQSLTTKQTLSAEREEEMC